MRADSLGACDPLYDADAASDPELLGHRLCLRHDGEGEGTRLWKLADVNQRRMGQCADWIERGVSPKLKPDLTADVGADRGLEAGFGEHFREPLNTPGLRSIWLSKGKAIAFHHFHDTRRDKLGSGVDHSANDSVCADI